MAKPEINPKKIVVFTGSGVSAASGLATFRDQNGLWNNFNVEEVASLRGYKKNPEKVIQFYNDRKKEMMAAKPNAAHRAIADLEKKFEVVVITTNIDTLHEAAGSSNVIHIHGNITNARSSLDPELIYPLGDNPIEMGQTCEHGEQLRPDVVFFGESVDKYPMAREELKDAARVLVVGSSFTVKPASSMFKAARGRADKLIVCLDIQKKPYGFRIVRERAEDFLPHLVQRWLLN
ncbi:SIR2 family NAD-dependent protein deacylase [Vibrio crassostreae]|uniref:SIR2 family NAD-dependent protein deacylase n=1 Tax=Vibrio crassostreae TaxID=246167 RepID=UPI001B30CD8E|nr:Sir2 family NAD-dependent protein deacetylase [Vibrio crassostreae]